MDTSHSLLKYLKSNIKLMITDRIHYVYKGLGLPLVPIPKHYLDYVQPGCCNIILLQGVGKNWAMLRMVGDRLSHLGFPVHIISKLRNNSESVSICAKVVKDYIDQNGLSNIILVAHSKGGLIGKYVLTFYNDKNSVKGMVAISTPFNGTDIAKIYSVYNIKELMAESSVVKDLLSHTDVNSRIISIFPSKDDSIWHEKGSYLDNALDNIVLDIKGHSKPLYSDNGIACILSAVERISKLK